LKPEELVCRRFQALKAYDPTRSVEALAEEVGVGVAGVVKLDGNENPYGPSPRVKRALSRYPYFHIYPDPYQKGLRKALADYVGLGEEFVVAGAGSDELIDLILRLFLDTGDRVINLPPTFGMYPFSTLVCGGEVVEVPRDDDFHIDLEGAKKAVGPRTKVVFVASPNNPSGNTADTKDIRVLLKTGLIVVVDEAYYEFCGETVAPLVARYDNLIVLRTFSKWAGLAGLRLGYGVFSPAIAEHIMKMKPPYNINAAAHVAALESLKDLEYLKGMVDAILKERERLFFELSRLLYMRPYSSRANFILCRVMGGRAKYLWQGLRQRGVFVRYFDTPRLRDFVRISVGRPEDTDTLLAAMKEVAHG
jgi:histidinol-phosphate aminotransferase